MEQGSNSYLSGEIFPLEQHDSGVIEGASSSGARLNNIDLNASYEDYSINADQETDSSSDPLLIGDGNEDGIRLSSKRNAEELHRQLTIGEASSSNPQTRNSEQVAVTGEENVDINLNQPNETNTDDIGENETNNEDGVIVPSNEIHQATYVARQQQNQERNIRQRTDGDFSPANLNLNAWPAHDHASDQAYHVDPLRVAPPLQPLMVHHTTLFAQSRTAPADVQPQEVNIANVPRNVMVPPSQPERQNYLNTVNNMNYASSDMGVHLGPQIGAPSPVAPQTGAGVGRLNYMRRHERLVTDFFGPPLPDLFANRSINVDGLTELLIAEETMDTTEDHILPHLRQQRYQPDQPGFPDQDEHCCICQDGYVAGEDITNLQCGHYFHVNCITRWLMRRNSCPICQATGLAALVRDH